MGYNTKNLKKDAGGLITPQAFNTGADDYETLNSTSGSLHTKVTDPLPAGTNEIGSVKLSGRSVELTTVVNALAIRDTANHDYTLDLWLGGEYQVHIYNTNNQSLNVREMITLGDAGATVGVDNDSPGDIQAISPFKSYLINGTEWRILQGPVKTAILRLSCATAPTTGSVTVILSRKPN